MSESQVENDELVDETNTDLEDGSFQYVEKTQDYAKQKPLALLTEEEPDLPEPTFDEEAADKAEAEDETE